MKKSGLILGLFMAAISVMGQVKPVGVTVAMSDGTYVTQPFGAEGTSPVIKNGRMWWAPCAYYQKKFDTTGITNPNLVILSDTAKVAVYEVGGHLNIGNITGTMAVILRITYTDEFGLATVRNLAPNGTNTSALTKLGGSTFNPIEITPLKNTLMLAQIIQVPGTTGTIKCNTGAHFKALW